MLWLWWIPVSIDLDSPWWSGFGSTVCDSSSVFYDSGSFTDAFLSCGALLFVYALAYGRFLCEYAMSAM